MSRTVSLASLSTMAGVRSALVVISPATTTRSVVTSVSQATRLDGSAARQWSRMASLIWSATLSGWPMETDSLVNRYRSEFTIESLAKEESYLHRLHCRTQIIRIKVPWWQPEEEQSVGREERRGSVVRSH